MKKNILLLLLFCSANSFAQRIQHPVFIPVKNFSFSFRSAGTDTLWQAFADTNITPTLYLNVGNNDTTVDGNDPDLDSGYICGTNKFGDLEKAERFIIPGSSPVYGILFWFGAKQQAVNPGYITAKIYSSDTLGRPKNLLASEYFSVANIDTSTSGIVLTYISFTTPPTVIDTFFASFEVSPMAGDTVGLISTKDSDAVDITRAWEKWSNGEWHLMSDTSGWNLKIDLAIFPVIDASVGISDAEFLMHNAELNCFPNPARDNVNIFYSVETPKSKVNLKIIDVTGRTAETFNNLLNEKGRNNFEVNVKNLSAGIYFCLLEINSKTTAQKIVVAR